MAGLEAELHPADLQEKTAMLETIGVGKELLLHIGARADLLDDASIFKDEHGRNPSDAESCP